MKADDVISRQAAIDACLNGWNKDYKEIVEEIRALPPVIPQYTDAEIQKMQDLEFAEIQKAYEIGKAENPNRWGSVIEDIKSEINELSELDHIEPTYEDCKRDVLEVIDRHTSGAKMREVSRNDIDS